jgi:hypothetical protein
LLIGCLLAVRFGNVLGVSVLHAQQITGRIRATVKDAHSRSVNKKQIPEIV